MKNQIVYLIASLLFLITILVSCNGAEKSSSIDENQSDNELSPPSTSERLQMEFATQIAEYVVEVFEDSKGNLWFGTMANGAARYDGNKLTYFSTDDGLCGNTISSFAEDKDGNLYFGSHTGLCKYDGKTFSTIQSSDGVHNNRTGWLSVQSDMKGNIWMSSNKGVFRYDGIDFLEFKLPIDKSKISEYSIYAGRASLSLTASNGDLWFATDGGGAYKYDGKTFTHFTKEDGLCSNNITRIIEDKDANIWIACVQSSQPKMTGNGGLCKYDGNTITQFPTKIGLSENDIYTIYEDKKGAIWIGATGHGIYRYDGEQFHFIGETNRMDLTSRFGLQDVLEDTKGRLWFGFSGGLFRLVNDQIINVTLNGPWE